MLGRRRVNGIVLVTTFHIVLNFQTGQLEINAIDEENGAPVYVGFMDTEYLMHGTANNRDEEGQRQERGDHEEPRHRGERNRGDAILRSTVRHRQERPREQWYRRWCWWDSRKIARRRCYLR